MKNFLLAFSYLFVHMSMIFGSRDIVSEVYYFSARFYDSKIGRFISSDPVVPEVQSHKGLNHYSYVYNNPLKYKDPTGHVPFFQDTGGQEEPSTVSLVLDKALNIGLDILDMVADTGDYLIDAMLPPKVSQNSIYGPEPFVFDKEFLGFLLGTVGGGGKAGPLDDGVRRLSRQGPRGKVLGHVDLKAIQDDAIRLGSLKKKLDAADKKGDINQTLGLLGAESFGQGNVYKKIDLRPKTDAAQALGLDDLQDQLAYLDGLGRPGTSRAYLLAGNYPYSVVHEARKAWEGAGDRYRFVPGKARRWDKVKTRKGGEKHIRERRVRRRVVFQALDGEGNLDYEIELTERWNGADLRRFRERLNVGN